MLRIRSSVPLDNKYSLTFLLWLFLSYLLVRNLILVCGVFLSSPTSRSLPQCPLGWSCSPFASVYTGPNINMFPPSVEEREEGREKVSFRFLKMSSLPSLPPFLLSSLPPSLPLPFTGSISSKYSIFTILRLFSFVLRSSWFQTFPKSSTVAVF